MNLLSGLAISYEFSDKKQLRPEAFVGIESIWSPTEGQQIRLSNRFYQQLDAGEYRNLTRGEWRLRVLGSRHLSLSLGFDNEFDSDADGDRNSLKYWTTMNYHY